MQRVTTVDAVRDHVGAARGAGKRIALVATMGALHEGHLALVRLAAERADMVVVSIFVNPTQFDRADDLAAYPRDLAGDEASLSQLGDATPALVFAPAAATLYREPVLTTVHVAELTGGLCGRSRPGHFDGVATIVTKLLHVITPDVAVFGRKDAQQLAVVRRLVADLDLPVEIVAAPTVRESDGLALSSRNRRLSPQQRADALALPSALRAAVVEAAQQRAAHEGHGSHGAHDRYDGYDGYDVDRLRAAAARELSAVPDVETEYLEVVEPATLQVPLEGGGSGRLLVAVAAHVGPVRLIDNVEIGDRDDERRLLASVAENLAGGFASVDRER